MGERLIRAFDQSDHPNLWINKDFRQRRTSNLTFSKIGLKLHTEGALRPIRNRKTVDKIIQNQKTEKKNLIKTENRMQNCQNRNIFTSQLLKP